ncbi:MAG: CDP-diacylglycerol--serine O-phosphatidyltransferase [Deltaproteobacteria bacterium HGW-Deltaproteobacteria-15]|jgi:CDP-diacylglycerol--serine O-phosphatidyltransferase|nr:MAG: CDP-diacylglycerol--serine O-phosphatidyltransferase [Deltaproteobacteria bacterium HGW-Deltaproteobacteria-15]
MRTKRRKKIRQQKERKGIYILPNLFTSASLFGGFFAIIASTQGRYEAAAISILVSAVLDGLDGRVARFTRTTSHFGVEYDSLSDVIAFGVAPGILVFQWAMKPFGRFGWLAAFLFVVCGALRLARFNVQKTTTDSSFFRGLPIPAAACVIASLILFIDELGGMPENAPLLIVVMIYILSFLMVSTIGYTSFKKLDLRNQKPFNFLVSLILMLIVVAYKPKIMIFLLMFGYALSGPLAGIFRIRSRRRKRLEEETNPAMEPAPLPADQKGE